MRWRSQQLDLHRTVCRIPRPTGVCAILVVIHGLANVMQETALLRKLDICAQLGGEDTGQLRHFHRMCQLVLSIRSAEFQATHHAQDFSVQAGDVGLICRLFARFVDDLLDRLGLVFQNLFDVRGMNAPVQDRVLPARGGRFRGAPSLSRRR